MVTLRRRRTKLPGRTACVLVKLVHTHKNVSGVHQRGGAWLLTASFSTMMSQETPLRDCGQGGGGASLGDVNMDEQDVWPTGMTFICFWCDLTPPFLAANVAVDH